MNIIFKIFKVKKKNEKKLAKTKPKQVKLIHLRILKRRKHSNQMMVLSLAHKFYNDWSSSDLMKQAQSRINLPEMANQNPTFSNQNKMKFSN